MFKKIKNLHLFILVFIISFISLFLIKEIVLANWLSPTTSPAEGPFPNIVTSPLTNDIDVNGFDIIQTDFDGDYRRAINFQPTINIESPGVLQMGGDRVLSYNQLFDTIEMPTDLKIEGNVNIVDGGELLLSGEAYIKASALNTFIGINTGENNNNLLAISNTFVGTNAGWQNISGDSNTFVGFFAGAYSTWGEGNTFLGYRAGVGDGEDDSTLGNFNTIIGFKAGEESGTDYGVFASNNANTFVGAHAGRSNTKSGNTFIGSNAGLSNNKDNNTFVGASAGLYNDGDNNTFLGTGTGQLNSKDNNTFVGGWSGGDNDGEGNVFLGYKAGYEETGDDKLYIANSDTDEPLIYGDFYNRDLVSNAMFQVQYTLGYTTDNLIYANAAEGTTGGSLMLLQNDEVDKFQVDIEGNTKLGGDLKLYSNEYLPAEGTCNNESEVGNIYFATGNINSPHYIGSRLYICVVRNVTQIDPPAEVCSNDIVYSWEQIVDFTNLITYDGTCGSGHGGSGGI